MLTAGILTVGVFTAGVAAAKDAPPDLACTPALPHFCANIHVSCAGRSRRPTRAFTLTLRDGAALARFEDGETARLGRSDGDMGMVLRADGVGGYIRVMGDRFSQRIYVNGQALMTRGRCIAP